ncbi:MAG: DUF2288 domain-containing protein [Natronospirillum sp.]|uniref:DUF2288 domain-containing protein n=1 Tax=Natronospirillum sp. TaxID=2812955 RepID=UPI0025FB0E51|nr:DUF2288 family protein [Natronospirillum sp.]MCH8550970.1 DUF2288 domain-containing protein [Natronospirillum sp.]
MTTDRRQLTDDELNAVLNTETARINWLELQPNFARGQVIHVADNLDLVAVAREMIRDNKAQFEAWTEQGQVAGVSNEQAQAWYDQKADVWAVVVAPWVLVQSTPASAH